MAAWLDDEWTPLEVHSELGQAAASSYVRARQQLRGEEAEVADVLLAVANDLLLFPRMRETFTGALGLCGLRVEMGVPLGVCVCTMGVCCCCSSTTPHGG